MARRLLLMAALLLVSSTALAEKGNYDDQQQGTSSGLIVKGMMDPVWFPCQDIDPSLPYRHCTQPVGGQVTDRATFDTSGWNADVYPYEVRMVRIWVEWYAGVFVNGFAVTACVDRDDDGTCTRNDSANDDTDATHLPGGHDDRFATAYSNDGVWSESCEKATKDCDNPRAAELHICVPTDTNWTSTGVPDDEWDDLHVYVNHWVDEDLSGLGSQEEDNLGFGTSLGTLTMYAEYLSAYDTEAGCIADLP